MSAPADRLAYLRKGSPAATTPKSPESKQPYLAFQPSKELLRHLEIRLKYPEPAECPINGMITNIRLEWRWGLAITLIYGTTMVVQIKGKNLQVLAEALKEWKVAWIAEFDAETFDPPLDDDAPCISSIEIITERPEPAPPMGQRH